jgi:phosphate transport system substrate-binding protein
MKRLIAVLLSIAFLGTAGMANSQDMIQVKGSDTLINLVQKLAEVYMQKNPGKAIAVTGGGSGTGIAALINGQCDIADASRSMKDKERKQAADNGIDVREIVVANDGICVVVNKDNSAQKLSVDQLGRIYRGEVTNWKEVGGKDMAITLYGRQPNSGTYSYFKKNIVKDEYSSRMREMNGNSQIIEALRQDKSGIGYVGVGYARNPNVAVVKVAKTEGGEYISPLDTADVIAGKYAISRALYQYVNGVPSGAIRDFIAFELSAEGQKIVEEEGFFQLNSGDVEGNKANANL